MDIKMEDLRCQRCNKVVMSGPVTYVTLTEKLERKICEECVTSLLNWWYQGQLHASVGNS
jgi:hypothetical protein